jgi:2-oxoglutarate dehydrogenase E2 component (dihydrolipoamide succinyltransferase)
MAIEIKVPDMGESVIEATIARWMKQEGERVAAGEPVVELETDKVNLEVGAQQAGVLQRIQKQVGDSVAVGDVLAWVDAVGAEGAQSAEEQPAAQAEAPAPTPDRVPAEKPAAPDRKQPSPERRAPERQSPERQTATPVTGGQAASQEPGAVQATPVATRMAQEQGIDLARVTPTGPGGRITKEDVEAFLRKGPSETKETRQTVTTGKSPQEIAAEPGVPEQPQVSAKPEVASQPPARPAAPAPVAQPFSAPTPERADRETVDDRFTVVRLSRRRQTIARRLVEAQHTAAMLTTFNEADMSRVMELRKRRREEFKERFGVDLGFMPFFVKACIGALKSFPNVNAELRGEELILKHYYDIGIAIGAEEGLVVPVIRDADRLTFAGIEKAIRGFVEKSKNAALTLDDLRGGTFTITNGGVYGSLMSTPILNPPQVAILGMHAIKERPVVVNGEMVIRPMMYLALSYDHRVVDGREAVQFLVRIKEYIEDPEALLLG